MDMTGGGIPTIFLPEEKLARIKAGVIYCDACRNYNTLRCPCGRFDKTNKIIRRNFSGLGSCCDFAYDGTFGQQLE
ncbi:MAG: hypothetical protein K2H09_05735, partial [Treponemataceae bacterium]|nr:hypothetical protein [Treponemataceae bacterium]